MGPPQAPPGWEDGRMGRGGREGWTPQDGKGGREVVVGCGRGRESPVSNATSADFSGRKNYTISPWQHPVTPSQLHRHAKRTASAMPTGRPSPL